MKWYRWRIWRLAYNYNEHCRITDAKGEWKPLFKGFCWLKKRAKKL